MVRKFDGIPYFERSDFILPRQKGPEVIPTSADKMRATKLFGFVVRAVGPTGRLRNEEDIFVKEDAVWELHHQLIEGMQYTGIVKDSRRMLDELIELHQIEPTPPARDQA